VDAIFCPKTLKLQMGFAGRLPFKVLPQDDVDVPPELWAALQAKPMARRAWSALSAGKQRGLAYMVASAKRTETQQTRIAQVIAVLLGEAPLPWVRK
jgi:uncharacterized protein YdeI (YjbR/CyaY-like superfamily)